MPSEISVRKFNAALYLFLAVSVMVLAGYFLRADEEAVPDDADESSFQNCEVLAAPSAEFISAVKNHRALVKGEKEQKGRVNLTSLTQPCLDLSKKSFPFSMKNLYLVGAHLDGSNLSGADLAGANLTDATLEKADLSEANLSGVDLSHADLNGANLGYAHLEKAQLIGGVDLAYAYLGSTRLAGSDLTEADLRDAGLYNSHFDPSTDLHDAKLQYSFFEPQDLPDPVMMGGTDRYLRFLKSEYDPTALTKLRRAFRESGQRKQERDVTYAIMKAEEPHCVNPFTAETRSLPSRTRMEKMSDCAIHFFDKVVFDATFRYGSDPLRPFVVFLTITIVCALAYAAIIEAPVKSALFRVRVREYPDRSLKLEREVRPRRIREQEFPAWFLAYVKRAYRVCNTAFFFSLISAFNLGIEDFDLGKWIRMLSREEFELKPKGWARTVSGIQSLIALMFLALFIYSAFGHPFSE